MRVIVINTGTEITLGHVLNTHLTFIAREIFALRLRVARQLAVPDGPAIRDALSESFGSAEIIFVAGGLGPTTDDLTREITAELLGLDLRPDTALQKTIKQRLFMRGIRMTDRISRQAKVPQGAIVLPNENGTAPGLYLAANLNPQIASPHLFLLPGPPRELEPIFRESVRPLLRQIVRQDAAGFDCRTYRLVGIGESHVEESVGAQLLAIPGLELGYCARMGEVDLRVIGPPAALEQADAIVRSKLATAIFSTSEENLEATIVRRLAEEK